MASSILWPVANVVCFGINTIVTFSIGAGTPRLLTLKLRELLGSDLRTNKEISEWYPNLVTPSGWAFSIWSFIFMGEALSVTWQCFAPRELRELLIPAAPYLSTGFLLQGAWTVAFAQERIGLSAVLLGAVTACLAGAYSVTRQVSALNDEARAIGLEPHEGSVLGLGSTACTYLCTMPFAVHLAWLSVASLVNLNMFLSKTDLGSQGQLNAATASKWVACAGGILATFGLMDASFAFVAAWALRAISQFKPREPTSERGRTALTKFLNMFHSKDLKKQSKLALWLSYGASAAATCVFTYNLGLRITWAS